MKLQLMIAHASWLDFSVTAEVHAGDRHFPPITAGTSCTLTNPIATLGKEIISTSVTYDSGSIFEWNLTGNTDTSVGTRGTDYDAVNTAGLRGTGGAIFRVVLNRTQNFSETFWESTRTWAGIFKNVGESSSYDLATVFNGGFEYWNSGSTDLR